MASVKNLKRIAFFWIGMDTSIPSLLVKSIRHSMGFETEVVQISDPHTPAIDGVTHVKRLKVTPRDMVARLQGYSSLNVREPTLFLDADMLVLRDFDLPPLADNEVGVTRRHRGTLLGPPNDIQYPEFQGQDLADVMPYIYSFVYTCSGLLFVRQLNLLKRMPRRYQEWFGDQVTLKQELDSGRFLVREFSVDEFNCSVGRAEEFEEVLQRATAIKIAHFKGVTSKPVMFEAARRMGIA